MKSQVEDGPQLVKTGTQVRRSSDLSITDALGGLLCTDKDTFEFPNRTGLASRSIPVPRIQVRVDGVDLVAEITPPSSAIRRGAENRIGPWSCESSLPSLRTRANPDPETSTLLSGWGTNVSTPPGNFTLNPLSRIRHRSTPQKISLRSPQSTLIVCGDAAHRICGIVLRLLGVRNHEPSSRSGLVLDPGLDLTLRCHK